MKNVLVYAKAHTAAILALVMWLVASLHDGNISGPEWLGLPAALGIGGAVAAIPNAKKAEKEPRHRSTRPAGGYGLIELVFAVFLLFVLIALFLWLLPHHR